MVKRIGSIRRKTKHLFKKSLRERGKLHLKNFLQTFKVGDRVVLKIDSTYQKGLFHPRFYGRQGIVKAKQGKCYLVQTKDMDKVKTVLTHPIHLKKV